MSEQTQEIIRWTASIGMAITIFGGLGYLVIALRKIDKEKKKAR